MIYRILYIDSASNLTTLTRAQMILLARFSTEYHTSKAYKTDPGSTTSECGACSSCKAAEATACCPG